MPWVSEEMCVGCGLCVEECPVGAISLQENDIAAINDDECIRCGHCHEVCPEEAVRHDSERIPFEVEANVEQTRKLLGHFHTPAEQRALLERMVRYFTKEQKVAEQSIEAVKKLMTELE
jgi:ferredoxin